MPLGSVLIVEDDAAIRRGVADALRFAGYTPREEATGTGGLRAALGGQIDLLLLDVVLPEIDGFRILDEVRKVHPTLPVIMLTAKGTEEDRIRGLRNGADDYVVKPFSARELLARVDAVLRRSPGRTSEIESFSLDGRTVNFARREVVFAGGGRSELSEKEAALLHYLVVHKGRVVSRDELLAHVWGLDPRGVQTRAVDMHIVRLRERLRDDPAEPRIVLTVRAKGYMLGEAEAP